VSAIVVSESNVNTASQLIVQKNLINQAFSLPIRAEKTVTLAPSGITTSSTDFQVTAALRPYYSAVYVAIPGRGFNSDGSPNPSGSTVFNFLINPAQVSVSRQMVDAQSNARGGWMNGLWGEDLVSITATGKTPGRYFSKGLTDGYAEYSLSYQNLAAFEVFYENNGYYFEGEQANEGPLAAGYLRRRIQKHQDVVLTIGEFIWSGMFESLTISENSDSPFLAEFTFTFLAWKERFLTGTPYLNSIANNVQRGHVTNSAQMAAQAAAALTPSTNSSVQPGTNPLQPTTTTNSIVGPIMNPQTSFA
jgi:hypothetical protein